MNDVDITFYFDPVCPFAWMTSKWVRTVTQRRSYSVEWKFISLRMINSHLDYDAHFPAGYEATHTAGLRLLRVAAHARSVYGADSVGPLYEAMGARIFDTAMPLNSRGSDDDVRGTRAYTEAILAATRLPAKLADALEDESLDVEIRADTDEALGLTGKDVGTPIIHYQPPSGPALFGPVISRLPNDDDALQLWDHVVGLATFPGFAELKRSLREKPQLLALGVGVGDIGVQQDWQAGRRASR
jgi:hypothetical protein